MDTENNPVIPFDQGRAKTTQRELGHMVPGVLTAETIEDLRKRKILREAADTIDIEPVGPGERTIGYLNSEERTLYIEIVTLTAELEEMSKEQHARALEQYASAIRNTPRDKNPLKNLDNKIMFPDEAAAEEYYSMITTLEYIRAVFNQSIRERYGHSVVLGVRTDFVVVRTHLKYEIPAELIASLEG